MKWKSFEGSNTGPPEDEGKEEKESSNIGSNNI